MFQKRLDGSVDFYRGWDDYKRGFGNLTGEFWLGLEKIHRLTSSGQYKLRVDLEDYAGKTGYAEYDSLAIASEGDKYKLSLGSYSGLCTNKDDDDDDDDDYDYYYFVIRFPASCYFVSHATSMFINHYFWLKSVNEFFFIVASKSLSFFQFVFDISKVCYEQKLTENVVFFL